MKKNIICALATGCLVHATLFANKVGELPHQHLKYKSAVTTYELVDGNDVITVTKEAMPPLPAKMHQFKITISRKKAESRTYSLLTLGVQSVMHDVMILSASAGAKFGKISDATAGRTAQLLIPKTGLVGEADRAMVEDKNVWLISFETEHCELLVQPVPSRVVTTEWSIHGGGFAEGHGTEPPP